MSPSRLFFTWKDVPERTDASDRDILRRDLVGERLMVTRYTLRSGVSTLPHHHPHEQFTHILSGFIRVVAGEEERVLGPDGVSYIPPNLPHSFEAIEETVCLDIYSPPREDHLAQYPPGEAPWPRGEMA